MQLYLMRHAEALPTSEAKVALDEERPLAAAGIAVAQDFATRLRTSGVQFDRIFTSLLVRAKQTAEIMANELRGGSVQICEGLQPGRDPMGLMDTLRPIHAHAVILAVGHQPGLARLAARLLFGHAHDGIILEPGGVCWIELPDFPVSVRGLLRGLWNP